MVKWDVFLNSVSSVGCSQFNILNEAYYFVRSGQQLVDAELNTSTIIIKHIIFNSWTRDFPDLIKLLNISKTTQAFRSSTEM